MAKLKDILLIGIRFFPVQLLFLHFKKSHLLLLIWAIMFGFAGQLVATKFGVPYLFLSPEYLGEVSWLSFAILGFSIGGYFMAFHLYSYILLSSSFPFIATLSRPFFKFSVNNSFIPTLFYLVMLWNIWDVQYHEELRGAGEIILDMISFTCGIVLFIVLSVLYFFKTNLDVFKLKSRKKRSLYTMVGTLFARKNYWFESHHSRTYQPSWYFASLIKLLPAREADHYDKSILKEVFRQNHLNASVFELIMVLSFLMLGFLQDYKTFQIPSGASIVLLFTFVLMVVTVFYSWFKGWAISLLVGLFLLFNYFSRHTEFFKPRNYAYGLDYEHVQPYSLEKLQATHYDTLSYSNDLNHHIAILDNWKKKACKIQETDKPKLVIVNCSGGGIRSAMWTYYVFQGLEFETEGKFFDITHMVTGASGGMIGASYYRELYLRSKTSNIDPANDVYLENISKDLLNHVSFSLATHDLFLRYKKVEIDGKTHLQDRGYAFEQQLNENTDFVMDRKLGEYAAPEEAGKIPIMYFSPTIINDGRRLIISSQPSSFLNGRDLYAEKSGPENVEFLKLFADNDPLNVKFTSVLRMNSTFPYILPMVTLPTSPEIQVMDAGIRDNYGTKTTVRYLAAIEDWLAENTSGVVLVEIRDINKDYDMENTGELSLFNRITRPIGNFYGNYHHAQEYNASELVENISCEAVPVDVVTFVLRNDPSEMISLSWHLTQREKNDIKNIFRNEYNQKELNKLIDLLNL